jgi:hypothetical protein
MFLVQLLGFWLVLSQPSSARVRDAWLMEVIKVCGREFARTVIDVCGQTSFQRMALSQEKRALDAAPPAGESFPSAHLSAPPIGCSRAVDQSEGGPGSELAISLATG